MPFLFCGAPQKRKYAPSTNMQSCYSLGPKTGHLRGSGLWASRRCERWEPGRCNADNKPPRRNTVAWMADRKPADLAEIHFFPSFASSSTSSFSSSTDSSSAALGAGFGASSPFEANDEGRSRRWGSRPSSFQTFNYMCSHPERCQWRPIFLPDIWRPK